MKRIWESVIVIIVTLFVVDRLLTMIQPYTLHIIITVIAVMFAQRAYNRYRQW